jgi:hypothetical protein
MLLFVPGQRWYSTAEPELGLGTILRADNRQVDIIFTGNGELKHYTQTSAPLIRCQFSEGDQVVFHDITHRVDSVNQRSDVLTYTCGELNIIEGALDSEQAFIPPTLRLLLNQSDQSYLYDLRKSALMASQLDQDQFEHFIVDLLSHFGCLFTPLASNAFLLDCSQMLLDGFEHLKQDVLTCSFDPIPCAKNPHWHYINQQNEIYLAATSKILSSQMGNASFLLDDSLPTRSAVLETVFTDDHGQSSCFALDALMNILSQFKASEQAVFRSKNSNIDLKPYKRSLDVIFPNMLEATLQHALSLNAGKLQALRIVAGAEFALFGKNKR